MGQPTDAAKHPILQAFQTRLEGNELFKSGDYRGALLKYHAVLAALRGVHWPAGGTTQTTTSTTSSPAASDGDESDELETAEGQDDGNDEGDVEVKGKGKGKQEQFKAPEKTQPDDENMDKQIKDALKNTYLNSAAIYVKQERWSRALESAKAAQKYEEASLKAKFREGQALIGLGRIWEGKRLLEELQTTNPDSAVKAALAKLDQDEAKRETDKQAAFRGIFHRDTPSSKKDKQADAAVPAPFSFGPGSHVSSEMRAAARPYFFGTQASGGPRPRKTPDRKPGAVESAPAPKKEEDADEEEEKDSDSSAMPHASTSKGDSPTAKVVEDVKNVVIDEKEEQKPVAMSEQE